MCVFVYAYIINCLFIQNACKFVLYFYVFDLGKIYVVYFFLIILLLVFFVGVCYTTNYLDFDQHF